MSFADDLNRETQLAQRRKAAAEKKKAKEAEAQRKLYAARMKEELPADLKKVKAKIRAAAKKGERSVNISFYQNLAAITEVLQKEGLKADWYEKSVYHNGGCTGDSYTEDISGIIVSW